MRVFSTAATLSWNYVQEDEGDGIDIEMPSRAPKLHRSFEAGRVTIKSLISCRDATGAVKTMEIDQLAVDTQQEECWHKTDDVVDVNEVDKTSSNRDKHWHFAPDSHVESSMTLDKNVSDQCCDGKTYDKEDEHKDDNKKHVRDESMLQWRCKGRRARQMLIGKGADG